jgi:PAS domain S-box-containing protein
VSSILVLDDRAIERELLVTVLGYAGHAVVEASTGTQALELARETEPDLIIVDLLMPGMNGPEFVRELRSDQTVGETRVVFCTATYDDVEIRKLARTLGVSHILVKPCEPAEIISVVNEALGTSGDATPLTVGDEYGREQLRVLNAKLVQKVSELEAVNLEQIKLGEQLRQAERQTAESLTLLQTLQSSAPVGFGFVDRDFRIVQMNETLAAVQGLALDQQIGRTVAEIAPELWPAVEPIYRQVLETGEPIVNVPVAEKYEVDQWVLTQAARLAAAGTHLHANLSAASVGNRELLQRVEQVLHEAGADPANLVLEITETALMEDLAAGEAFARGITDIGCGLALDDFGTGYGSLTYLQKLPIRFLKIDIALCPRPTQWTNPQVFTEEAWFKTTTATGGVIVGFGNTAVGPPGSFDRLVYMAGSGQLYSGIALNQTVHSTNAYNDGNWHLVDATVNANGMSLYVDGALVGVNTKASVPQGYNGYWRVGDESTGGWSAHANNFFTGTIDNVAVYPAVLGAARIATHYLEGQ